MRTPQAKQNRALALWEIWPVLEVVILCIDPLKDVLSDVPLTTHPLCMPLTLVLERVAVDV